MTCDVDGLMRRIVEFRDRRNWAQFHTPKDLALCLFIEAATATPSTPTSDA